MRCLGREGQGTCPKTRDLVTGSTDDIILGHSVKWYRRYADCLSGNRELFSARAVHLLVTTKTQVRNGRRVSSVRLHPLTVSLISDEQRKLLYVLGRRQA